jgi:maltooligosyltrehalose trehalohydrolase
MPIADFPGHRNWGYDGVLIYAPARAYGTPDDLRRLVDAAHGLGLAVILDVVYNHLGPDGNYLSQFSGHFFHSEHHTPWGAALNFDGHCSGEVREFFVRNPLYWMEQFHIDGVRLDATHAMIDQSDPHIFSEITRAVHGRGGYVIAEDCRHEPRLVLGPDSGGYGFDGIWADDFHHVVRVALTGEREGYFEPFEGSAGELAEVLRRGWLGEAKATARVPPSRFIHCISNHDQAGNRAFGERLNACVSAEAYRSASALLCLSPFTPLLFMGQEWAASTPFLYFTHHNEDLGPLVTEGRRREFAAFPGFRDDAALSAIPDPQDARTFERSRLCWEEAEAGPHAGVRALYRECLRMRRKSEVWRPAAREGFEVAVLRWGAIGLRLGEGAEKRLLVCDLKGGHSGKLGGEPIARLPAGEHWECIFSSNEKRFGGDGAAEFDVQAQRCAFEKPGLLVLMGH